MNLRGLQQITRDSENFSSEPIQRGFRTRELVDVASNERNFRALSAKLLRDNETQPARAAGDESDFVRKGESWHSENVRRPTRLRKALARQALNVH